MIGAVICSRFKRSSVVRICTASRSMVVWCSRKRRSLSDSNASSTRAFCKAASAALTSANPSLRWFQDCGYGLAATVVDVSTDFGALALQGPLSRHILKAVANSVDLDDLKFFRWAEAQVDDFSIIITRTGYTGDLGYELFTNAKNAHQLWDRLWEAGHKLWGLIPIGLDALEIARLEAGFLAPGFDFQPVHAVSRVNRGRTPFELGFGRLVNFDKGHFNGRRALLAEKQNGTSRRCLVGLDIEGNKPAAGALVYHRRKKEVGHITSAMWSPTCKQNIALASLIRPYGTSVTDNLWVDIYTDKEKKWARQMCWARIVERPFFKHPRRNAVPAGDY